jgi:hypothetical protein
LLGDLDGVAVGEGESLDGVQVSASVRAGGELLKLGEAASVLRMGEVASYFGDEVGSAIRAVSAGSRDFGAIAAEHLPWIVMLGGA